MRAHHSYIFHVGLGLVVVMLAAGRAWPVEGALPVPTDGYFNVIYNPSYRASSNFGWRLDQGRLEGLDLSSTRVDGLSGYRCTVPHEKPEWGATKRQFFVMGDALCGYDEMRPPNDAATRTVPFYGWRFGAPTPAERLEEAKRLVDMSLPGRADR